MFWESIKLALAMAGLLLGASLIACSIVFLAIGWLLVLMDRKAIRLRNEEEKKWKAEAEKRRK